MLNLCDLLCLCSIVAQRRQPHLEDSYGKGSGRPGHTDNRGAWFQALSTWHHHSSCRGKGRHSQVQLVLITSGFVFAAHILCRIPSLSELPNKCFNYCQDL